MIKIESILKSSILEKIKTNHNYREAFTHRSFSNEHNLNYSYERLEFLGDSILGENISNYIWHLFPEMDEGQLTSLRSKAVRQETLAAAAIALNLQDYLFLGNGEKNTGGQQRESILSDIFESFIAAVYLDLGNEAVKKILSLTLFELIKTHQLETIIDYKTKLQELVQAEKRDPINYKTMEQVKKENTTYFVVNVYLDNKLLMGQGKGTNKKKAEQEAAKSALDKLSEINISQFLNNEKIMGSERIISNDKKG